MKPEFEIRVHQVDENPTSATGQIFVGIEPVESPVRSGPVQTLDEDRRSSPIERTKPRRSDQVRTDRSLNAHRRHKKKICSILGILPAVSQKIVIFRTNNSNFVRGP